MYIGKPTLQKNCRIAPQKSVHQYTLKGKSQVILLQNQQQARCHGDSVLTTIGKGPIRTIEIFSNGV